MHDKLPYDPRDLAPIARVSNTIVAIVVPSSSPINSLAELVAAARAEPGKLNWATITGFFDFMFEGFRRRPICRSPGYPTATRFRLRTTSPRDAFSS
jgi:hypothetical protein